MTKYLLLLLGTFILWSQAAHAQYYEEEAKRPPTDFNLKNNAITIGFLQGGGSLIGVDYERLIDKRLGLQVGAGLVGFGGGVNIHMKPEIKSSFVHLGYWHQGVGELFAQNLAVATFAYRSKKWFTAQVGLGRALSKGPAWDVKEKQAPVQLIVSLGGYFTFK